MTPRFWTESDGRIDDSPTFRERAVDLHRLDLESTTRASLWLIELDKVIRHPLLCLVNTGSDRGEGPLLFSVVRVQCNSCIHLNISRIQVIRDTTPHRNDMYRAVVEGEMNGSEYGTLGHTRTAPEHTPEIQIHWRRPVKYDLILQVKI